MKGEKTMIDMNEIISNVTLTKVCSVSPDNESKKEGIHKVINVKVKFDGATLRGVFDKAVSSSVISWQNGVGRKGYDKLVNNQVVEIAFVAPASASPVDPMESIIASAKASGLTVEQYVIAELKRRQA